MENQTSFDLNAAIQRWRAGLAKSSSFHTDDLDELESHVRDSATTLRAQGLTDEEAFVMFFLLVSAGGESTTSLTGTGVRILAERPDLQDRLRNEPQLVPAFVEEACRIDPPFRGHY